MYTARASTRLAPLLRPVFARYSAQLHAQMPPKIVIDLEDLKAFEESFDSQDIPGSSSNAILIPSSSPTKQSPVRPHNRQFEQDFEYDLSDLEEIEPLPTRKRSSPSKLTQMANSFNPTTEPQLPRQRIPQPYPVVSPMKGKSPTKLEDLEEIFADDDLGETQLSNESLSKVSELHISAPETSSPTYHRVETLYPTINNARARTSAPQSPLKSTIPVEDDKGAKNPFLVSIQPETARQQDTPIDASTQFYDASPPIYPNLAQYDCKHQPKLLQFEDAPATIPAPPRFNVKKVQPVTYGRPVDFDKMRAKREEREKIPDIRPKPEEEPLQKKFEKYFGHTRSEEPSRPTSWSSSRKKTGDTPQLMLMTQTPVGGLDQKRGMATDAKKVVKPMVLSEEQQYIVSLVLGGESLFYTGSAGTGKSVLLKELIKVLRKTKRVGTVAVTASTGLAACNVGGTTLHSFAGIGLGKGSAEDLVKFVRRSRKAHQRWKQLDILIIDEISMISGELFDKLDHIACSIRKNDKPFGGIQVICCGDFFQLPPVSTEFESAMFCFESNAWKRTIKSTITLEKVFRQEGDLEFIDMLNDMRKGIVTYDSLEKFRALERDLPDDGQETPELFSTRNEVEKANSLKLKALKTPTHIYEAKDGGTLNDLNQRERLLSHFMAPPSLTLKKGAAVMLIKNLDESLVNGSLGTVLAFIDRDTYLGYEKLETGEYDDLALEGHITRTKHEKGDKDLGSTLKQHIVPGLDLHADERLEDTVFDFFNDIESDDEDQIMSKKRKIELMNTLHQSSRGQKLPLVKFMTPSGHHRTILVNPETWKIEDERQTPLVTRMQLPLMLSWALSVHKSQGQTLPKVRVNLSRIFEKGQAYVAISRATGREGLQVLNFDETKVFAHPKVIEFYAKLTNAKQASDMLNAKLQEDEEYDDGEEYYQPPPRRRAVLPVPQPPQPPRAPVRAAHYVQARERVSDVEQLFQNYQLQNQPGPPPLNEEFEDPYAHHDFTFHDEGSSERVVKRRRRVGTVIDVSADYSDSAPSELVSRVYSSG